MKVIADISYNSEILETFLVKLGKIRMPVISTPYRHYMGISSSNIKKEKMYDQKRKYQTVINPG